MTKTQSFNAEIRYWLAHGALSWPTKDFLEIFRYESIINNPEAVKAINRTIQCHASTT